MVARNKPKTPNPKLSMGFGCQSFACFFSLPPWAGLTREHVALGADFSTWSSTAFSMDIDST